MKTCSLCSYTLRYTGTTVANMNTKVTNEPMRMRKLTKKRKKASKIKQKKGQPQSQSRQGHGGIGWWGISKAL